jgi:DNA-directed RNA polymerase subunit RPC12/RpoP
VTLPLVAYATPHTPPDPPPDPPPTKPLRVWRCCRCGAELGLVWLAPGTVLEKFRCWRCGEKQGREAP